MKILCINCGSSSLKACLFNADGSRRNFHYAHISDDKTHSLQNAFKKLLNDLGEDIPTTVGHRFVHGGEILDGARIIDDAEYKRLNSLIHLAPLHLPSNLMGLDVCRKLFNVPQIACFDTSFHASMPALSKTLPIPGEFGLHRFGFHGLNYAYIARVLPNMIGETANKKIIVAHLGSGASLCLLENLQSVDTTMGYTPAGGITMGTRSGDIDPGVMVELSKRYSSEQLCDIVFHKMGLLALSNGESAEMQILLASTSEQAHFAVEYFCRQVRGAIGALVAKAGGVDALVFTAGIGEHSAQVRKKICEPLGFLGFTLDDAANTAHIDRIERRNSKPIVIIPADEEIMIRDLCLNVLAEA